MLLRLAFVLAIVALAVPTSATARGKPSCPTKHARVLASGVGGKLVATEADEGSVYGPTTTLHVCRPGGRRMRRETFSEGVAVKVKLVSFTRRYVAYAVDLTDVACTKYDGSSVCFRSYVNAFDLRTGRRRASAAATAQALVLASNGWIAWVPGESTAPVLARVAGETRTLDAGPVDPSSLAVAGREVRWLRDGAPQSAELR